MRRSMYVLMTALLTAEAVAAPHINSMNMLCEDIRATIRAEGEAVVRFGSKRGTNMELFQRFVRDSRYCEYGERVKTTYIPAADTDSCRVFHCVMIDRDNGGPLVILPRQ